jgi:hypothetical protein
LKFDNPINFLTQENSKKFLNMSKPESLYDLYYKGTEFKDIQEELESSHVILKEMEEKLVEAKTKKMELESDLKALQGNLDFLNFNADEELLKLDNEEQSESIKQKRGMLQELSDSIEKMDKSIFDIEQQKKSIKEASEQDYKETSTNEISDLINELTLKAHGIESEYQDYMNEKKICQNTIK